MFERGMGYFFGDLIRGWISPRYNKGPVVLVLVSDRFN